MNPSFGPWSTALGTGNHPELSTFWKRRMTMLGRISKERTALRRRTLLGLVTVGVFTCLIPTLREAPAHAQQGERQQTPTDIPVERREGGIADPQAGKSEGEKTDRIAETTQLRWKFRDQEQIRYRVTEEETWSHPTFDQTRKPYTQTLVTDFLWTVTRIHGDGSADVKVSIERIRLSREHAEGKSEYDSGNPAVASDPNAGRPYELLAGSEFEAQITPLGEVVRTRLPDSLKGSRYGALSEGRLALMVAQPLVPFPDAALRIGESWARMSDREADAFQAAAARHVYTFQGPAERNGREFQVLEVDTVFAYRPPMDENNFVRSKGSRGTIHFDPVAGRVVTSSAVSKMLVLRAFKRHAMGTEIESSRKIELVVATGSPEP